MPQTAPSQTESAALLETILATAPVGLGVLDRELRFARVNEALATINGVSREGHLGRTIEEIWPTIPRDLLDGLHRVLDGGEAVRDHEVAEGLEGRPHYVLGSYYPVLSRHDEVIGIGVVVVDITERKAADEALRSSERRLREMLENVQLIAVSIDLDGRITFCNPYLATITGRPRQEVMGRDWYEIFTPPELSGLRAEFLGALAGGSVRSHSESPIQTRGGERRLISWNNTVVLDPQGRPAGATSIGEDITERRRAEEGLRMLAAGQGALRRVATAVAREADQAELFECVTAEVGRLLEAQSSSMIRFEGPETALVVGGWSEPGVGRMPVGALITIDGDTVIARVRRSGTPARVDDYASLKGTLAQQLRELGFRSAVGAPIHLEGRLWGCVTASTVGDEVLPGGSEKRLGDFAELVAQSLANAESREQLRASRARIVEASDAERRRLERNLHDGAQSRLVALSLTLRRAQARLESDPEAARRLLRQAGEELAVALEELRELARGLHPAALSDHGLGPALEQLAGRSAVPVVLAELPDERFPEPVEVAAFYVVSEALTNVAKYAQATSASVRVTRRDGGAVIEVSDDGVGGADLDGESGLRGLRDRVEALGGQLDLTSPPGAGTAIRAEIPA